jgi:hypothetical protein
LIKRLIIFNSILLLLCGQLYASSGDKNFKVDVLTGFDGFLSTDYWIPVTLLIETKLSSFSGKIFLKIPYGDLYSTNKSWFSVSKDLYLVGGQQKAIQFTLPITQSGGLEIVIYDNMEPVFSNMTEIRTVNVDRYQLLIPGNSTDLDFLRQLKINGRGKYQTNYIHPDFLPESAIGYSIINSVVIHDTNLNESRMAALKTWVRNGGNIFITGSIMPGDLPVSIIDILPVNIIGPVLRDLGSIEWFSNIDTFSLPIIRVNAKTGANVILQYEDNPLIVHRKEGEGNVYYVSINPGDSNYNNWTGRVKFWDFVFSLGENTQSSFPVENPLQGNIDFLFKDFVRTQRPVNFNIFYILLPLVVFYLLIFQNIVKGKYFVLLILFYSIFWSILIIIFLHEKPSVYYETEIVSSKLNNPNGRLFVRGDFAVSNSGLNELTFSILPELILPAAYNQSIILDQSGEKPVLSYEMDRWDKKSFYLESNYHATLSGAYQKKENNIVVEINNSQKQTIINPIVSYKDIYTDDFIILNEKDSFYLSFDLVSEKVEENFTESRYPEYYSDFLLYLKTNDFLNRICEKDSVILITEIEKFKSVSVPETKDIGNKAFLILEIPVGEFIYAE